MTTDSHQDFSYSTSSSINSIDIPVKNIDFESSLDSYSNLFDKDLHNFTTSSKISFINHDDQQLEKNALSIVDHNRTFIKDTSRKIINIFTGKPISPNPWRKLCTKNIQHEKQIDDLVPIHAFSPDPEINQDKLRNQIVTRQLRRDIIKKNQGAMNNTDDEDDQAFEQLLLEHRTPVEIQHQQSTPLRRRRKKRNSLKDLIDNASSSSDEDIKEHRSDLHPKMNRSIDNESSWYRLADVYTSEESDENNHLSKSNTSYSIRLKSEIYTSDHSCSSMSLTKTNTRSTLTEDNITTYFNFLESLSEQISLEDKHPDAKVYFIQPGFKLKEKREELANKLLLIFNQDVFSSQLSDKVSVVWSGRLTATAGHCTTLRNTGTAVITLSHKVCDSPERCRDTLLHEMCHAAVTLIDNIMEHGHGPLWRKWTRTAEESYPYLPSISVRHTYDVIYKFIYRCVQCQYEVYRHSKSLNLAVDFCGKCMGQFSLIINNNKDDVKQTQKRPINKYNLYIKEHFQTMKQANPYLSTPQLMKQLSQQYKQEKQQQEHIDLPYLDQLKI